MPTRSVPYYLRKGAAERTLEILGSIESLLLLEQESVANDRDTTRSLAVGS